MAIPITCERDGKGWLVRFGNLECPVEDSVGMSYLAVLVDNPGYEISALELASGPDAATVGDSRRSEQRFLDDAAVRAYRARLSSLRAEIDEYEAMHDPVRVERARVEYDWLVSELVGGVGLGGRPRRFADNEERARISVGKAIRRAINRIATMQPDIAEELRSTVHTGMRCRYQPYRPARQDPARQDPALQDPALQDPALQDPARQDPAQGMRPQIGTTIRSDAAAPSMQAGMQAGVRRGAAPGMRPEAGSGLRQGTAMGGLRGSGGRAERDVKPREDGMRGGAGFAGRDLKPREAMAG